MEHLHPHQGDPVYIKLIDSTGSVTFRRFQVEYKWWSSLAISQLRAHEKHIKLDNFDEEHDIHHAMDGMVKFLMPVYESDCINRGYKFAGTIELNWMLPLEYGGSNIPGN